jgi:hypothetical protein
VFDLVGAGVKIEVIGVHSLNLDEKGFRKFFFEYLDIDETDGELEDIDAQLFHNACSAALVELVVDEDTTQTFDVCLVAQEDPKQPKEKWQVAWNETYLTIDGEAVIAGYPLPRKPKSNRLRVAFYIHCFPDSPSVSYNGASLQLPTLSPMPERLWRLVPYQLP